MAHPTSIRRDIPAKLNPDEIEDRLCTLPAWHLMRNAIERVYEAPSYRAALDKLNVIAHLSETADHHPEMVLEWKRLTVRYWTHDADGVTERDFELAQEIERLL